MTNKGANQRRGDGGEMLCYLLFLLPLHDVLLEGDTDRHELMSIKKNLEQNYIELLTERHDQNTHQHDELIQTMQNKLNKIDHDVADLIQQQNTFYNPIWERVFRAGAEESFFAYQVDRYACIYMEKLADLFRCSPLSYFRAHRRVLAHDYHDN